MTGGLLLLLLLLLLNRGGEGLCLPLLFHLVLFTVMFTVPCHVLQFFFFKMAST